jgi:hypothetical protein
MHLENQAHDDDRIRHYAQRGIRELLFHGGTETQSFAWLYEQQCNVICNTRTVFNYPDEIDDFTVQLSADRYLDLLGRARLGETVESKESYTIYGTTKLQLSPRGLAINTQQVHGYVSQINFDALFLDSLSVIENSEPRLRTARNILKGPAEASLLDLVNRSPELLHSFSPREFEYFVGAFMTNAGFSQVRLSRFVKDGGYDLWALYCEGDAPYTVVIEVKHYARRRVGLEIVDRINGVRDREHADRAIVFTSSSFSTEVGRRYSAYSKRVALVDFERLVAFLRAGKSQWKETASKLWTLPFSDA